MDANQITNNLSTADASGTGEPEAQKFSVPELALGSLLKNAREELLWTQAKLASLLQKTPGYICKIEANEMLPTKDLLAAFARHLKLDEAVLIRAWDKADSERKIQKLQKKRKDLLIELDLVPMTQELDGEVRADPAFKRAVESLRDLLKDDDLVTAGVELLLSLSVRAKLRRAVSSKE